MSGRSKRIIFISIFLALVFSLNAKVKALWITPWDMVREEQVVRVVNDAREWGVTDLLVEVRYRGDALYRPNREFSSFPNPEPISYLLRNNPDFDALESFIRNARNTNIRIHAWVTVNVVTTRRLDTIQPNHIYRTRPEWLTNHVSGRRIVHTQFEGAFLDPGIIEVQNYLVNVFSDIVQNYDIDGFHLDYIRYPHPDYGYNPESVARFNRYRNRLGIDCFQRWKEIQVREQVRKIGESIKRIQPNIIYTAAVFANIEQARNRHAQNWHEWLDQGLIDQVYIMAYNRRNRDFGDIIFNIPERFRNRVVVGLRAWCDDRTYPVQSIKDKISMIPSSFAGTSFFSYGGIIAGNYQSAVLFDRVYRIEGYVYGFNNIPLKGAKITNRANNNLFTFTDENGFFTLNIGNPNHNEFTSSYMNFTQTRRADLHTPLVFNLYAFPTRVFDLNFLGTDTGRGFFLWWDRVDTSVRLYRKSLALNDEYTFIARVDRDRNFFYDIGINRNNIYEYRLVQEHNSLSHVFRTQNRPTHHLIDTFVYNNNRNTQLEIMNRQNKRGNWMLQDMSMNTIAQGRLGSAKEVFIIPEMLLEKRFLILSYVINEERFTKVIDLLEMGERS